MDPLSDVLPVWEARLHLVFVVDRQVVDDVLSAIVHPLDPLAHKSRHLVGERGIVGDDVWHGVGDGQHGEGHAPVMHPQVVRVQPPEIAAWLPGEVEKWAAVIKAANVTVD